MAMFSARGLNNFISDLRACTSREDEQKRVDKELVKMRQKFTQNTVLNSYDKKKYAWKLIYIFMLGYDIDFGHMQVINLVSGTKYSEKCLGYLGCSILLKSSDELMTLVVNSIGNDLKSPEACNQCLALCCVANLGGSEFSEALSPGVVHLLMSSSSIAHVRKKAALCARRMLPPSPELIPLEDLEPRLHTLLSESHLGVVTSAASLLQTALSLHPTHFRSLIDVVITRLAALVVHKACPRDYMYYNTPCPWLQVKLLRLLQQFGPLDKDEDKALQEKLDDTLRRVLSRPTPGKGAKNNAAYAVLIETVNLVISQGKRADPKLKDLAVQLLARFISVSEPNIRYIGLDSMYRLVRLEGGAADSIKQHKSTVLFSLKDADNSVRRRALDLLFSMCDSANALELVGELVNYLAIAEGAIREELVLKAAILAEKYAPNLRWYVDTVLQLITIAGAEVPDAVWHRVVQIVTNKEELQQYTAEVMFRALEPAHVDETTAKFGAYVLGEFGYLICDNAGSSSAEQLDVLTRHYTASPSVATKCLLLTAFVKMANLFDDVRPRVLELLKRGARHMDLELQQRACEYLALHQVTDDLMKRVLEPMPVFPENRESALIVRLRNQQKATAGEAGDGASSDHSNAPVAATTTASDSRAAGASADLLALDDDDSHATKKVGGATSSGFGDRADAIRTANPVSELVDIFGGASSPPAAPIGSSSGGGAIGIDPALTSQVTAWTRQLLLTPQGVLFENDLLQIGAKHEYRGSQGRVQFFFGNKTPDAMTAFHVQISDATPAGALRLQAEAVADSIGGKQQLKQQVMVEAMMPFAQPPVFTVRFAVRGTRYEYPLTLPSFATSFFEPVALQADDFLKRWRALEGGDREIQDVVTASGKIDMAQTRTWLTQQLKFAQAEGVDQGDASVSIAATFRTGTTGPAGDKVSVGCLARIDVNLGANAYRITVRAVHRDISVATASCLKRVLA